MQKELEIFDRTQHVFFIEDKNLETILFVPTGTWGPPVIGIENPPKKVFNGEDIDYFYIEKYKETVKLFIKFKKNAPYEVGIIPKNRREEAIQWTSEVNNMYNLQG